MLQCFNIIAECLDNKVCCEKTLEMVLLNLPYIFDKHQVFYPRLCDTFC